MSKVRPRVLVVDDDPTVLSSMLAVLDDDFDTATANTAIAAMKSIEAAAAEKKPFHVVCSDWHMPGMDGLDFFDLLSRRTHLPAMSCILITGHVEELPERVRTMDRRALGIVKKPFAPADFLARVEHYAHVAHMRRAVEMLKKPPNAKA